MAGAAVAFLLPDRGPGGIFVNGSKSTKVVTDSSGKAVMPRLQVNANPGHYAIGVTASHEGLVATATVAQTSIAVAAAGLSTAAIIGIVAGVAAAGGVAAVVATKSKGNTSTPTQPSTTPSGTVGVGSGTGFGPPH